jgi:hypothetical protein
MKATKQTDEKRILCEKAYGLFREFRGAYVQEWQRLENCERMYRGDHWHDVPVTDRNEPRPVTPILQSTIENIKSELMDRVPEAVILPESPADADVARVIEAIIRQNHDAGRLQQGIPQARARPAGRRVLRAGSRLRQHAQQRAWRGVYPACGRAQHPV